MKTLRDALGELAERPLFFIWSLSDRDATGKYHKKLPVLAFGGDSPQAAYSRGELKTFDAVCNDLQQYTNTAGVVYAVGMYLAREQGVWCLDIDGSDPTVAGTFANFGWQHACSTGCMIEYSSSGLGVHLFGTGVIPDGLRSKWTERDGTGLELYADQRAMCFGLSGQAWGCATTQCLPPEWAMKPRSAADSIEIPASGPVPYYGYTGSDDDIIKSISTDTRVPAAALLGVGGPPITPAQLWAGDSAAIIARYPDAAEKDGRCSEADLQLANILARATGGDIARTTGLMWRSGLVREKWTTNRGKVLRAVRKACAWVWSGEPRVWGDQRGATVTPAAPPLPVPAPELPILDAHTGLEAARAIIREAGSLPELLHEIAPRIVGMGLTPADLEICAADMRQRSDRLNDKLPIGVCRAALHPSPGQVGAPDWLHDWVFIADLDAFYYRPSGQVLKRAAADSMMRENDLPTAKSGKPIPPMELFFDVWRGKTAHTLLYTPGEPEFYMHANGGRVCNSFNFNTLPETAPDFTNVGLDMHAHIARIENHLHLVCNNRAEEFRLLMGWLASVALRPGEKIPWAPILQGVQGCGKSFVGSVLRKCLGDVFNSNGLGMQPKGHVRVVQPSDLANSGGFTDWANGRAVTIFEEIYIQGGSKWALANIVKPYITEFIVSINRKGSVGAFDIPNHTNYIAFTNHRDAVPLELSDRRWFVLFCTHLDAMISNDREYMDEYYFPTLWKALYTVPAEVLRKWLEPWLAVRLPKRAPATEEKGAMQIASESEITEIVQDHIAGRQVVAQQEAEMAVLASGKKATSKEIVHALTNCGFQRWMGGDKGRTRESHGARKITLFCAPAFAQERVACVLLAELRKNTVN